MSVTINLASAFDAREAPQFDASLRYLIRGVRDQGLEGLVAKRRDSRYERGERSGAWAKMRVNRAQELVIGGYTVGGRRILCGRVLSNSRPASG